MTKLLPQLRAALGLSDEAELRHVARAKAPDSAEGLGFAGGAALSQVIAELTTAPYAAEPVRLPGEPSQGPLGDLRRWTRDPGIFLLDTSGLEVRIHGGSTRELGQDALVVDARERTAWVRLTGRSGDLVWSLGRDGAVLMQVEAPRSPLQRLADAVPPALPQLEIPAPEDLTGGQPIETWLREETHALASSPALLDRAAAAGMLGRLWSSASPERRTLEELLAMRLPGPEARAWMATQPATTRESLVAVTLVEADHLAETLPEVERAVLDGVEGAREQARRWIAQRDHLESVRFVLGDCAELPVVTDALARLDVRAAAFHGIWSLLEAWEEDPVLLAVSWREPDAWWGRLAGI
jgi:hypothetical protein